MDAPWYRPWNVVSFIPFSYFYANYDARWISFPKVITVHPQSMILPMKRTLIVRFSRFTLIRNRAERKGCARSGMSRVMNTSSLPTPPPDIVALTGKFHSKEENITHNAYISMRPSYIPPLTALPRTHQSYTLIGNVL